MKENIRQGEYKGGIWTVNNKHPNSHSIKTITLKRPKFPINNPKGTNQYTKKEITIIKPLTDIEKYHKACKVREQIEKHKTEWTEARNKYRSLSQKIADMYKEMEGYLKNDSNTNIK